VAAVTDKVAAAVGVPPDAVVLVPPGAVPKTSSGKIRRSATREQYLAGALGSPRRTPVLARLRLLMAAAWAMMVPRLRVLSRGLYLAYLALTLVPLALATWALALTIPGRRRAFALARGVSHLGLRILGCRLSASGLEHLAGPGPFLLASNHASYVDIPTVQALLPIDFLFLAKREVVSWPVIGAFVRRCGFLTVDRWNVQQSVADARQVAQSLAAGDSVLIFPEGTFTEATGLRPFRMGLFTTAVETGVPVVPMALTGTRRVLRGDNWLPRPGHIRLWVGPPIVPPRDGWRAAVALRDAVAAQIAEHCDEPVLDLVAGGPVRPEP
jgi:1-acyl-sn-glycerol-3-phosphate acyltransferase